MHATISRAIWKRDRQASNVSAKRMEDLMARRLIGLAIALAATIALSGGVAAQDYPNRTVKIIVPFPPGGTADAMPRIVAEFLARKWGQAVIIEN
jgi:tripartite-type tricarboxylate transporter receptor subunit TctC